MCGVKMNTSKTTYGKEIIEPTDSDKVVMAYLNHMGSFLKKEGHKPQVLFDYEEGAFVLIMNEGSDLLYVRKPFRKGKFCSYEVYTKDDNFSKAIFEASRLTNEGFILDMSYFHNGLKYSLIKEDINPVVSNLRERFRVGPGLDLLVAVAAQQNEARLESKLTH